MKITKRDIKFFFLGVISFLIFESIYDWKNTVESFKRGFNGAHSVPTKRDSIN